ncbi:hypothetical protein PsorP6_008683 [Peronosclerospora sorghi]|uniref:Uncharacterized protein n=1 Tax=Peronosclerospora sorghi TaxID=230839 RepID=A0ACC0VXU6_9STRA|nr:hypothetical protein PsorP6_008683 [Peronosclerospora sorghi]
MFGWFDLQISSTLASLLFKFGVERLKQPQNDEDRGEEDEDEEEGFSVVVKLSTHRGSRVNSREYLYEIEANDAIVLMWSNLSTWNAICSISLVFAVIDFSRLRMFNRVIENEICYHTSVNLDIYDMFQQRYQMDKRIYNHRKSKAVEL